MAVGTKGAVGEDCKFCVTGLLLKGRACGWEVLCLGLELIQGLEALEVEPTRWKVPLESMFALRTAGAMDPN